MKVLISPRLDFETLSAAHVLLCRLETELKHAGRSAEADMLAYVDLIIVDLIILTVRNSLLRLGRGPRGGQSHRPQPGIGDL